MQQPTQQANSLLRGRRVGGSRRAGLFSLQVILVNRISRLLVLIASILAIGAFVLPLWKIQLVAPQYPEGLGMYIRIDDVVGASEFDLSNINKLNHYIGMKPIDAHAIPELRFMPWLLGALIVLGMVAAVVGRRRVLYAWLVAFALLGAAGLADFWRWGYDYGHNLDRDVAVIEVPGMTYQPPLIGSRQLLNFYATSWPASGSYFLGASFALGLAAALLSRRGRPERNTPAPAVRKFHPILAEPAELVRQ